MAFDRAPETTRDRADYLAGTTRYTLRVLSYAGGADLQVSRVRGGVATAMRRDQVSVQVLPGGGAQLDVLDTSLWAVGDSVEAVRSTGVPALGSLQQAFGVLRELLALGDADYPDVQGGVTAAIRSAIATAIAGQDPAWTTALQARLEATMSRNEVTSAIDAALDDLPSAVRAQVTGDFVVALLDRSIGGSGWRTQADPNVEVDANQMSGDGSADSPLTLLPGGITVGILAANAVRTLNVGDEQITLAKLSAILQANWQNMLLSVRQIEVAAGVATATRVDGTTFTFNVGSGGMGGSGALEVYDIAPNGTVRSRGTFTSIVFRDASVTAGATTGQVVIDPVFPVQRQADWTEAVDTEPDFIRNKPQHVVQTLSDRPAVIDPDAFYAWSGTPDELGGVGLYRAVPNPDTPYNLAALTFGDSTALRTAQALQGAPASRGDLLLAGIGMLIDSSANPIFLWLDTGAPAAESLYVQVRTQDASDTWSLWSSVITFAAEEDTAVLPSGLVDPPGTRRYRAAAPGGYPARWGPPVGGYGLTTQVRLWTNPGGTLPYNVKPEHTSEWLDDPLEIKAHLEALPPDQRLSTHFLKDGAVARVVAAAPTDLGGYASGELVMVLSSPPALWMVKGGRSLSADDANELHATTNDLGQAVASAGAFSNDPQRNYYFLHATAGDGTASNPARMRLVLDTHGADPDTIFARAQTPGFPNFTLERIRSGALAHFVVGGRTFTGYDSTNAVTVSDHDLFVSSAFIYDLYTSYTSVGVNTPFNVDTRTTDLPDELVAVAGGAVAPTAPVGGWALNQVASENREARNIAVATTSFSQNLTSADSTVQAALETLDQLMAGGGGSTRNAVILDTSAFTAADAGVFAAWGPTGDAWLKAHIGDSAFFDWSFDETGGAWTVSPTGKLLEWLNALKEGGWADATGPEADTVFIAQGNPSQSQPTTAAGLTFGIQSNAAPHFANYWWVLQVPQSLPHRRARTRLWGGGVAEAIKNLDDPSVVPLPAIAGRAFDYFAVQLTDKPGASFARAQRLTPFELDPTRFDLGMDDLQDVPQTRSPANRGQSFVWDPDTDAFIWGWGTPRAQSVLPNVLEPGARYVLSRPYTFRRFFTGTVSSATPLGFSFVIDGATWWIRYYGTGGGISQQIRGQLVIERPVGATFVPRGIVIDHGSTLNVGNDLGGALAGTFIIAAAPTATWTARSRHTITLLQDGDDLHDQPAAVRYPIGDYTARDAQTLDATPSSTAPFARIGYVGKLPARLLPQAGLTFWKDTLASPAIGRSQGLSVTRSGRDVFGTFEAFTPAVDGDDADVASGIVAVRVVARIQTASASTIAFEGGGTRVELEGWTKVSALLAASEFSDNAASGVDIGTRKVESGATDLGTLHFSLERRANNTFGVRKRHARGTGTESWSYSFDEEIYHLANDGSSTGGVGSFVELSDTPAAITAGRFVKGNASGAGLEFDEVEWGDVTGKPTLAPADAERNVQADWNETNSGSDAFIRGKPTIPQGVSSLPWGSITGKPTFAPANAEQNVQSDWTATGGDAFIRNKPRLAPADAERNVNADWNATSGDAQILNKPTLGSTFLSLTDTPSSYTGEAGKVPVVNDGATALELASPILQGGGGGKGEKIATIAMPTGSVGVAGAVITSARWVVEAAFSGTNARTQWLAGGLGGATLNAPADDPSDEYCGYVLESFVGGVMAGRSWIPFGALSEIGETGPGDAHAGRDDSAASFEITYKVKCSVFKTTGRDRVARGLNLSYLRRLNDFQRDNFRLYSAGQTLLANTTIELFYWRATRSFTTTRLTQAQYDALSVKDADTAYFIEE